MTESLPTPIRWGVLGASKFALEHMAPAIHAARGAEFAALATSSEEKAAPFRAFCPGLRVVTDYDALLADPGIDAVYIPLPNHLHVEWTCKALEAGKAVLTEKPIALTEAEFDTLIAARDRAGVLAAEAYMIVHHPMWQKARALYREGAIGKLRQVTGVFSYDNRADAGNIRNNSATGGGALRDIGVYTLGSARFVTGAEFEDLQGEIEWENKVDVVTRASGHIAGAGYFCMVSMRLQLFQEMTFHGEDGLMRVHAPFNADTFGDPTVELRTDAGERMWRFTGARHYVNQVENFCAAMRGEMEYPCPLEFSRGTQSAIDAIFASAGPPR